MCAVFSVDYNDELDLLVSGSADFSVKVWALSAGACLNTLTGHTEWVTKVRRPLGPSSREPWPWWAPLHEGGLVLQSQLSVLVPLKVILQKSQVESVLHSPGDHILLSADKYQIKVGGAGGRLLQAHRLKLLPCPPGLASGEGDQLQVLEDAVGVGGPQHQPAAPPAV